MYNFKLTLVNNGGFKATTSSSSMSKWTIHPSTVGIIFTVRVNVQAFLSKFTVGECSEKLTNTKTAFYMKNMMSTLNHNCIHVLTASYFLITRME